MIDASQAPAQKHPRLLYVLCATEIGERFAYYLMVGLFTLYLTEKLKLSEGDASQMYGNFTALVYLCPLFGGLLADRWLGYRRAIVMGAILMALGYFILASTAYFQSKVSYGLYGALFIIAMGNGLFKPNISTIVGNLYAQGDARRDSAFSIFYMGINIGALLGPIVGGLLRTRLGWAYAFAVAGIGMLLAMSVFLWFKQRLQATDLRSSVSAVLGVALPKQYQDPRDPPSLERNRIISIFVLAIVVLFFWMAFHQKDTTLTFWAKNNTDLTLSGLLSKPLPPEYFSSINPFFILTMTPVVIWVHRKLQRAGKEISTPTKIGLGMLLVALAFTIMLVASLLIAKGQKGSALWLVGCYFVVTVGELYLSPMGLSLVTKLAPARMVGAMMGVWFLATSIGNKLVGTTGKLWWAQWPHYRFFGFLVICSLAAAGLMFVCVPFMKRAMPNNKKQA